MSWPRRFEVWLVSLEPTKGWEIRKTRPCVVVSPDELNRNIATVIVAPMNTATRSEGKNGEIVLDQIRSVDRTRLLRRLGSLPSATSRRVCDVLGEMFAWG